MKMMVHFLAFNPRRDLCLFNCLQRRRFESALPLALNPLLSGPASPPENPSGWTGRLPALLRMEAVEAQQNGQNAADPSPPTLSKNAQKKLLKQQRMEAKKVEKRAAMKDHKKKEAERKRKEWEEMLASVDEEERSKLIESRRGLRKERMEQRSEEREKKIKRLTDAKEHGQNIVVDLDFSDLMMPNEINSLVQQVYNFCHFLTCLNFVWLLRKWRKMKGLNLCILLKTNFT